MELGSADAASAALLLPLYLAPLLAVGPQRLCSCAGGSPPTELHRGKGCICEDRKGTKWV